MPTINVTISDTIDVSQVLVTLGKRCESLSLTDGQQIVRDVKDIVYDLERRGKELASFGSQFRTVKVLKFESCNVRITATYGIPPRKSPLAWLSSLLCRR